MGENLSGGFGRSFACGTREQRPEYKNAVGEAYRAGKTMGYHLGYNLGFESGYEKGFAEGSILGYNNGFLAALGLGEENINDDKKLEEYVLRGVRKLIAQGQAGLTLTGLAAGEAEGLLRLIKIDATVAGLGSKL